MHPAPGFSHVAIATGSRLVYIAGQAALDRDFNLVGGDDLRAQTVAAMRNVETAIGAVGVTWDDIVRRTIYTTKPPSTRRSRVRSTRPRAGRDIPLRRSLV